MWLCRLIPAHAGSTPRHSSTAPLPAAHPRSRGEHLVGGWRWQPPLGSSPLTRGAHYPTPQRWSATRLIPAHAGSTRCWRIRLVVAGAHPRSRGEHSNIAEILAGLLGSSPLTRGAQTRRAAIDACKRLIPAHAGSTHRARWVANAGRAHPRSRGEHRTGGGEPLLDVGSSPLTRGAPPMVVGRCCWGGLIPAHAGSTLEHRMRVSPHGAHPRSRGEHRFSSHPLYEGWGSSPLTRGAPTFPHPVFRVCGLIPAHAGSTRRRRSSSSVSWAHPRSRGEHGDYIIRDEWGEGSSPLTRGAPEQHSAGADNPRLIPAHAGSTPFPAWHDDAQWAHPRSRGEHRRWRQLRCTRLGSSPLTRGAQGRSTVIWLDPGLIPAHAGSTHRGQLCRDAVWAHPRSRGEHDDYQRQRSP